MADNLAGHSARLPRSGVLTAVMLGVQGAIGETMAVMMVTGNAPVLATSLAMLFAPFARTMTATIAAEMGEVAMAACITTCFF